MKKIPASIQENNAMLLQPEDALLIERTNTIYG